MVEQAQQFKVCKQCGESKVLEDYIKCNITKCGRRARCKLCCKANRDTDEEKAKSKIRYLKTKSVHKIQTDKWREDNKERVNRVDKLYRQKNKEKTKAKKLKWDKNNKDKLKEYGKAYYLKNKEKNKKRDIENQRIYRINNKEKRNAYRRIWAKKRREDPIFRLNSAMSKRIRQSLIGNKNDSWSKLVNYTLEELKTHLESLFTSNMSWENYRFTGWHVEHILPICSFNIKEAGDEEFKKCWSLSNLRPLWATTAIAMTYGEDETYIGNLNKGGKIIDG